MLQSMLIVKMSLYICRNNATNEMHDSVFFYIAFDVFFEDGYALEYHM